MKRCVVIAAAPGLNPCWLNRQVEPGDIVICADAGYQSAAAAGVRPDLVLGDFDSAPPPPGDVTRFPREKDDTDTLLALRAGRKEGCRDFLILGGIGSRLDHTFANLTCLRYLREHGCRGELRDEHNRVFLLKDGECILPREEGRLLSVFSMDALAQGVTLTGVKYPLTHADLPQSPLGVSNVILAQNAHITVKKGTLLLFLSLD